MSNKGQTTRFAERVEIGERWQARQSDPQIAQEIQEPLATVRKWRRRFQRQGRAGLSSQIGRPKTGPLGHFSGELVQAVTEMRQTHSGWGPLTILVELKKDHRFQSQRLPSRSQIAAFLKEKDWARPYERHQNLPEPDPPQKIERPHQEWEVDAESKIRRENSIVGVAQFRGDV